MRADREASRMFAVPFGTPWTVLTWRRWRRWLQLSGVRRTLLLLLLRQEHAELSTREPPSPRGASLLVPLDALLVRGWNLVVLLQLSQMEQFGASWLNLETSSTQKP